MGLIIVSKNSILRDAIRRLCETRNITVSGSFNSCVDVGRTLPGQVMLYQLDGEVDSISPRLSDVLKRIKGVRCVALVPDGCVSEIEKSFGDQLAVTVSDAVSSETLISILVLVMGGYNARLSTKVVDNFDCSGANHQKALIDVDRSNSTASEIRAEQLSNRELAVMSFLRAGYSNKAIGRALGIQDSTVKAHLRSSFRRIGANNRTQAAMWAVRNISAEGLPRGEDF